MIPRLVTASPRIRTNPLTETISYYVGAPKALHHNSPSTITIMWFAKCIAALSCVPVISAAEDNSVVFCAASVIPLYPASDPICSILGGVTFGGCYLMPELERGLSGKSGTSYKVTQLRQCSQS